MTGELALIPEMGPSETNIANVSFSEVRHFFHPDPNPGCDMKKKKYSLVKGSVLRSSYMYTQPLKMHFTMFRDPDEREYRIRLENGPDTPYCRRRIKTEEKAKVVASVWGQILFNSLPR